MSTPTPTAIEDGLRNDYIRKQLVQAVFAADFSADVIDQPFDEETGALSAIPAAYVPVGYTSDDGLTFTSDLSMSDVTSSQSVEPTRSDVESDVLTAQYVPQETNQATVALFEGLPLSGEGALPEVGKPWSWKRSAVPKNPYRRLLFIGLDYNDSGEEIYVIKFFPRARLTERDDEQWARSTETQRPVTFTAYRDPAFKTPCANWVDGPGWRVFAPAEPPEPPSGDE
ncbi:phage tail protein [Streptomyces boncukensis]|uniref:Phage tail protein n=1 Tax=Streptomyces boncukensis TaxID=2711219 RepID=A0A6G4WUC1_9ACTN|nr:phage tail protein [Streptomyces boncukensis]NGO68230.1 phage tail protein [Streptomyces boncukensis]